MYSLVNLDTPCYALVLLFVTGRGRNSLYCCMSRLVLSTSSAKTYIVVSVIFVLLFILVLSPSDGHEMVADGLVGWALMLLVFLLLD